MNRNNCSSNPWGVSASQVLRWYVRAVANAMRLRDAAAHEADPASRRLGRGMMRQSAMNARYYREFLPI